MVNCLRITGQVCNGEERDPDAGHTNGETEVRGDLHKGLVLPFFFQQFRQVEPVAHGDFGQD
jgi:hypothetical protein